MTSLYTRGSTFKQPVERRALNSFGAYDILVTRPDFCLVSADDRRDSIVTLESLHAVPVDTSRIHWQSDQRP